MWSGRNQWQRTPRDIQHERGREASDSLDFCHHTWRYRPHRKQPESGGHFSPPFFFYRSRLKPDTSPVSPTRPSLSINPTENGLPSRLIPPYSPFVDECRGGSSCGNWYNVANQRRRGRGVNPGGGAPARIELSPHSAERPGLKTWNRIGPSEWIGIRRVLLSERSSLTAVMQEVLLRSVVESKVQMPWLNILYSK